MYQPKKTILFLEDSSKSTFGGGQKVSLAVLTALSSKFSIQLFDCARHSKFLKNIANQEVGINKLLGFRGPFEIFLMPVFLVTNFFILSKFIKKYNLRNTTTIVYAATRKVLLLAWLLNKFFGFKYIFHAHRIENRESFFYKITFFMIKQTNKIICVSNIVKKSINLFQCEILYNPVQISNVQAKTLPEKINVAVFSSLVPLKGIEYFMQSFHFLKHQEKVHYFVYGEGPLKNNLERYENSSVKLMGFTDNVNELLQNKINLIVVSSIEAESFSLILVEALNQGIPVIVTDLGGPKELVKNKEVGFLVSAKSPQQIAEKIDFLIDHPEIYSAFSKNALRYVKNFDLSRYREKILVLFNQI